jgi:hypothetical protein
MIRNHVIRRAVLGTLACLIALQVWAADNSAITYDHADAITNELRQIHKLLARIAMMPSGAHVAPGPQQPPTSARLNIEGGYLLNFESFRQLIEVQILVRVPAPDRLAER